jgi:hypothetical protein
MGQILDIPIIIRSLAISISMIREGFLPLEFDPDFLTTLDIGNDEAPIITQYSYPWWKAQKPRSLDEVVILDSYSLQECLDTHRDLLNSKHISYTPRPVLTTTLTLGPDDPSVAGTGAADPCQKCLQYKYILSDSLNDLVDIHTYSNAMFAASKNQWRLDMRRASTFNLLYEATVNKESEDPSCSRLESATPATVGLKPLPASGLTEVDVLSLRSGSRPMNPSRDRSQVEDDTALSNPASTGHNDDTSINFSRPAQNDSREIRFVGNDWIQESDEDGPAEESVPQAVLNESRTNRFVGDDWSEENDEDRPADEIVPQAIRQDIPETSFVGDSWMPASEEDEIVPQAIRQDIPDTSFVGDSWMPASEDDEIVPQDIRQDTSFVGDSWMPTSEEDEPASQPTSESPAIVAIAENWIAESDEYTPAVQGRSEKRVSENSWLPSSDEDAQDIHLAGEANSQFSLRVLHSLIMGISR